MLKNYRVKAGSGSHFEGDKEYKAGDNVPSHHNLHEKFENKFEPGVDIVTAPAAPAAPAAPVVTDEEKARSADAARAKKEADEKKKTEEESPLGENVTEDFPKVKGGGFTVFKKGKDYSVSEDDGKTAINPEPLKKATVEDFIACFAEASGRDLSQFMGWYDQAGTPTLKASGQYDAVSCR